MLGVIRGVGYTLAAVGAIIVVLSIGFLIAGFLMAFGVFIAGAAVVAFIALCIKEYCEDKPTKPKSG